jgi:hypothetical protein
MLEAGSTGLAEQEFQILSDLSARRAQRLGPSAAGCVRPRPLPERFAAVRDPIRRGSSPLPETLYDGLAVCGRRAWRVRGGAVL